MKFAEKLIKLIGTDSRAKIAKRAGLKPTVVNNYVHRGSEPMSRASLALARALNVPLDWLIDDEKDWPPPKVGNPSLQEIPDREILREVLRRRRLMQLDLAEQLDAAEKIDWESLQKSIASTPLDQMLARDAQRKLEFIYALVAGIGRFLAMSTLSAMENAMQDDLPAGKYKPADLAQELLVDRYHALARTNKFDAILKEADARPKPKDEDMMQQLLKFAFAHGARLNPSKIIIHSTGKSEDVLPKKQRRK